MEKSTSFGVVTVNNRRGEGDSASDSARKEGSSMPFMWVKKLRRRSVSRQFRFSMLVSRLRRAVLWRSVIAGIHRRSGERGQEMKCFHRTLYRFSNMDFETAIQSVDPSGTSWRIEDETNKATQGLASGSHASRQARKEHGTASTRWRR